MNLRSGLRFILAEAAILSALILDRFTSLPTAAARSTQSVVSGPLQAGCYLAHRDRCSIHVEPFTISLGVGSKLQRFQLVAVPKDGTQSLLYGFRTDLSNPVPLSGTVFTPSRVAKDFAATCGQAYAIRLLAQSSSDDALVPLGITGTITCPTATFLEYLPTVRR